MCPKKRCSCIKTDDRELEEKYGLYITKVVWPLGLDKINKYIENSFKKIYFFEDYMEQDDKELVRTLNVCLLSLHEVTSIDTELLNICCAYLFGPYLFSFQRYPKELLYKESLKNLQNKGNYGVSTEHIQKYLDTRYPYNIGPSRFCDLSLAYQQLLPQIKQILDPIKAEISKGSDVVSIIKMACKQVTQLNRDEILVMIFCNISEVYSEFTRCATTLYSDLFHVYKQLRFVDKIFVLGPQVNQKYFDKGLVNFKKIKKSDFLNLGFQENDYEYVSDISNIYNAIYTQYESVRSFFNRMEVGNVFTAGLQESPISMILTNEYFTQDDNFQDQFDSVIDFLYETYDDDNIVEFYKSKGLKQVGSNMSHFKTMMDGKEKRIKFKDYKEFFNAMLKSYQQSKLLRSRYKKLDFFLKGCLQYLELIEFQESTVESLFTHYVITYIIKAYFVALEKNQEKK